MSTNTTTSSPEAGKSGTSITAGRPTLVVHPGDQHIYPSVILRNKGSDEIGVWTVTVTAPQGISLASPVLTMSRSEDEGTDREFNYPGDVSDDGRTLSVSNVPLNVAPSPQAWVVLYVETQIAANAPLGELPVTFSLGVPAFASGTQPVTVTSHDLTPSVDIPTDRDVWIDHLASSLHLNNEGFAGEADIPAYLFHDRDNANLAGERWRFKAHPDGSYTITNANSGRELTAGSSDLLYKRVCLSGSANPTGQKWRVQPSGLYGSFSLHPADDLSVAVAPRNNTNPHLYLLPFQQYLTQFFKVVERNV